MSNVELCDNVALCCSTQGNECLHDLAESLELQLEKLDRQQGQECSSAAGPALTAADPPAVSGQACTHGNSPASGQVAAGQHIQPAASSSVPAGRLLLRLDHMRSKASYTRTIKNWAAQLNLTGGYISTGQQLNTCRWLTFLL